MSSTMLAERAFPSIRALWDTLLGRLRTDCITHDQHAQEYLQIVLPRLAQSNEFTQRVGRRGAEIGAKYQTELEDQMKRLDRTLKYYLKSRQSKDSTESKLGSVQRSGLSRKEDSSKIE